MDKITMPDKINSIKIAVNVMRARLTIIGFNLAIASFQINRLYETPGGVNVPGFHHAIHASSQISLLLAIALSMTAIVAYIFSSEYDSVGTCTSWPIIAGDLLMYCGLASTLAGFFAPIELSLNYIAEQRSGLSMHFSFLQDAMQVVGSVSWFLAIYVGPIHAISRSPFSRMTNIGMLFGYFLLLSALGVITATAAAIDINDSTQLSINQWLIEFIQPIRW